MPQPFPYPFAGLSTVLVILVFIWSGIVVGMARKKYDVWPPETSGPDAFNRAWRAHQNTFESLPQVIPALWLFAIILSDLWAGVLVLIWTLGRVLYVRGYCIEADKRLRGFAIASLALLVLLFAPAGKILFQLFG